MNYPVEPYKWWVYIGPGPGVGSQHMVTSVTRTEVTTWSDPRGIALSWIGTPQQFIKDFRPINAK